MEESKELKEIDKLMSKIYPEKKVELMSIDNLLKNLTENPFLTGELKKSMKELYNKLIEIQYKYIKNEISNKEFEKKIQELQHVAPLIPVEKVNDEMDRMYTLVQKVYHKMKKISDNLNDPANVRMKDAINNILKKGTEDIYGVEYDKIVKLFGTNSTFILIGTSSNTMFFDNVYTATTKMSELELDKFKLSYHDLFYNNNDIETKMRDLLEDALGSVQVFVKLKVKKNDNNDLITIDRNKISLIINDNKTQQISVNCYNGLIPEEYNRVSTEEIAENKASNKILYDLLSSKIDLALKDYNIICFGSGYSGAGKTFTLLKGNNSIIKEIYKKYGKIYTLKLSVFEQYGYWDIHEDTLLSEIFSAKNNFTEHLYTYDLVNIKDVEIIGGNKIEKLKTQLINNNYSVVINDIDSVLDKIEEIRKNNRRVKFTINNPESSRSHIYYLIKIIDTKTKMRILGHVTIIDMGGQENPREIFLDYMGGSKFLFENYFGILFANKISIKKQRYNPLPVQYHHNTKTVNKMFEYYKYNIQKSKLENQFNIITQIIDVNSAYYKLFPTNSHKWFFLSFYYPVELFLLIKFYSENLNTTTINNNYSGFSNKEIFFKLGKVYEDVYCLLQFLKETMNIFVERIRKEYTELKNIVDFFIKKSIDETHEKNRDALRNKFDSMDKDNLYNLFIIRILFESFLEGFYINETLVNKMEILKSEQMIEIKPQTYKGIESPEYNPFIGMGIGTLTKNIFDYLAQLSGSTKPNGPHLKKFIEIACIRADISQMSLSISNRRSPSWIPPDLISISSISNRRSPKELIENICPRWGQGYDLGFKKEDKNYKYKYAIASCITLKSSAMLSGAQCPTDKWCLLSEVPEKAHPKAATPPPENLHPKTSPLGNLSKTPPPGKLPKIPPYGNLSKTPPPKKPYVQNVQNIQKGGSSEFYYHKYLKYKLKYLKLLSKL